jgi:hypothetical protein
MKYSKQLLVTMPREEHSLLNNFLYLNIGKHQFKIVSIQVVPPEVAQTKGGESL